MSKNYEARGSAESIHEDLSVVIQAGGESKRMGQSKALVSFLGRPLIWRTIHRLSPIAGELIITTNEPAKLAFLSTEYGRDDIILRRDIFDRRGALTGLYTALSVATKPFVAVVACDMIFASAAVLEAELEYLKETGCDAAVPSLTHGYEPFHAVYRRETCLKYVKDALDRGECRANSWYKDAKLYLLDSEAVLNADPRGGCFVNVNTPEELAEMERRLRNDEILLASDE